MFKAFWSIMVMVTAVTMPVSAADSEYLPGFLYVKIIDGAAKPASGTTAADEIASLGGVDTGPAFQLSSRAAPKATADFAERRDSLAAIRLVRFPDDADMVALARELTTHPGVEYAEPVYASKTDELPNDPILNPSDTTFYSQFRTFELINAPEAWDIAHGDHQVVVAIVDTGTDWHHDDLEANLWTNPDEEPDNGVDDDNNGFGNGYVDDVHGWDFYGGTDSHGNPVGDNNPSNGDPHGTHVAGIAAGVTGNGIGIASLSHNVIFMPIKTARDGGKDIYFGFQGLIYAAENGADVVNCSWGGSQDTAVGRDALAYARSVNPDMIIVAAAGNNTTDAPSYPAAYQDIISVGAVDSVGARASFSNYGPYVTVFAPGVFIVSTLPRDQSGVSQYGFSSGTSMASPFVAALVALLKSAHPDWDRDRITAQIVGTATPTVAAGPEDQGFINAAAALENLVLFVNIVGQKFTRDDGSDGGIFLGGMTIDAELTVHNYGSLITNLTADVSSISGFTEIIDQQVSFGSYLDHGDESVSGGIRLRVKDNVPLDAHEYLSLRFHSEDGGAGFDTAEVILNPSYLTMNLNTITVSADGAGHVGFTDFPSNTSGTGFTISDPDEPDLSLLPLLFEGGLIVGTDSTHVIDGIRGADQTVSDDDFVRDGDYTIDTAPDSSFQRGFSMFTDGNAGATRLGLTVTMELYMFREDDLDRTVFFDCRFRNTSADTLRNLHAGLFLDFDIPPNDPFNDVVRYDASGDMVVFAPTDTTSSATGFFVGATVAGGIGTPWLILNSFTGPSGTGEFGIHDGFTPAEKWTAISAGFKNQTYKGPGDISAAVSAPPFTLAPGATGREVFILTWSHGTIDLERRMAAAAARATEIPVAVEESGETPAPASFAITSVVPNPFNPTATVTVMMPGEEEVALILYDILGRTVTTVFEGRLAAGEHRFRIDADGLASGTYFVGLHGGSGRIAVRKVTLLK